MRTLIRFPILVALLAVGLLASTSPAGAAQTTAQIIVGSGSDTTYYMMQALGDLYSNSPGCNNLASSQPLDGSCVAGDPADAENFFHDSIVQRYFIGSSGGINQVCKQGLANVASVDFARSSRVPLGASAGGSDCSGLHFVGYARDGISWECFPGSTNPGCGQLVAGTNNLTIVQLKNIFVNCSVTTWDQVGGTSKAIDVYVPQANSGTGVTWAAALGVQLAAGQALTNCVDNPSNPNQPGSNVSAENTNALIHINGDEANAIFPFSIGVYQRTYGGLTGSDGSSLGLINGTHPTFSQIQKGKFPVTRFLFNVYCAGDPTAGNKCGTDTASPSWVKNIVGEDGFLCKGENAHKDSSGNPILDPLTGKAYRTSPNSSGQPTGEIANTIKAQGFVPLQKQSDGTYCVTFTT